MPSCSNFLFYLSGGENIITCLNQQKRPLDQPSGSMALFPSPMRKSAPAPAPATACPPQWPPRPCCAPPRGSGSPPPVPAASRPGVAPGPGPGRTSGSSAQGTAAGRRGGDGEGNGRKAWRCRDVVAGSEANG